MKPCPDCDCTEVSRYTFTNESDKAEEHYIICNGCHNSVKAATAAEAEQMWDSLKKNSVRDAVDLGKAAYAAGNNGNPAADRKLFNLIAENKALKQSLISAWHCGYNRAEDKAKVEKDWEIKKEQIYENY